jgi:hypothetical protein
LPQVGAQALLFAFPDAGRGKFALPRKTTDVTDERMSGNGRFPFAALRRPRRYSTFFVWNL